MYVVTVSRLIDGKYGQYRICNIRDKTSDPLTLNLYSPHINKLQDNQVYSITKLKKTILKNNDESVRLSTTKFSQIQNGTPEEELLFQDIQVADNVLEGCCIMYTNLYCYNSCPKHCTKLDEDLECLGCKMKINQEDVVKDFTCMLQIEDNDDLKSILIFKRHLNKMGELNETEIEENLSELFIGKQIKVHYNKPTEENLVAVKIDIVTTNEAD